ncbi:MAG: protochlorophyllide oxidoreductase, partial [Chlorobiales bacterium]|nr:protochlorophyllide oxidoreductase [Chlorobiales bacterium]
MKTIILYDTRSVGGSTDRFVDALGKSLAETGAYVEKGKCKATADYSFLQDFDVVIM